MRVGNALSQALDPSQPLLFDAMGPLALDPEEVWHQACLTDYARGGSPNGEVCLATSEAATSQSLKVILAPSQPACDCAIQNMMTATN